MPLTPAFEASVYKTRRDEVLRRMREMASGAAIAIFPAMPVATRNSDVEHPYRAHSDLYWLTGFEEPEAVAVLSTQGDKPFTLFVRPRDKEQQQIEDPGQTGHELRLRKEPREVDALRKAVQLTRKGHLACMSACRPGMHEYDLHALLERDFREGGGRGWGYYPIVAAGENA